MNQESLLSLVRHTLSAVSGFLITKGLIAVSYVEPTIGLVLALISFFWSWKSKDVTTDQLSGMIRQILSVIGGILFYYGKAFDVNTIMSLVTVYAPYLLKLLGKAK